MKDTIMAKFEDEQREYFSTNFNDLNSPGQTIDSKTFEECVFNSCDFNEAVFVDCEFIECRFIKCNLSVVKMDKCRFNEVVFEECKVIMWTLYAKASYNQGTGCGRTAHPGLFGGRWVTGVPTAGCGLKIER